jgi:protein-tyrosine phosphatase
METTTQVRPGEKNRHWPLRGTSNLRDVGGYPTASGRPTRWQRLLRSDSLHLLDVQTQAQFVEAGLRTVIDLRYPDELAAKPNVFAASDVVRYVNIPLLDGSAVTRVGTQVPDLRELYRMILDERAEQLGEVLTALAEPSGLPAVVHCSAGKDRTGVVVAVVLALAGVSPQTIAEDYALTSTYFGDELRVMARAQAESRGIDWERFEPLLSCPPEYMIETLDYITERHGSVEAYVYSIGITGDQIAALRDSLLE